MLHQLYYCVGRVDITTKRTGPKSVVCLMLNLVWCNASNFSKNWRIWVNLLKSIILRDIVLYPTKCSLGSRSGLEQLGLWCNRMFISLFVFFPFLFSVLLGQLVQSAELLRGFNFVNSYRSAVCRSWWKQAAVSRSSHFCLSEELTALNFPVNQCYKFVGFLGFWRNTWIWSIR